VGPRAALDAVPLPGIQPLLSIPQSVAITRELSRLNKVAQFMFIARVFLFVDLFSMCDVSGLVANCVVFVTYNGRTIDELKRIWKEAVVI
jgi:hypothetical protein